MYSCGKDLIVNSVKLIVFGTASLVCIMSVIAAMLMISMVAIFGSSPDIDIEFMNPVFNCISFLYRTITRKN